MIYRCLSLTPPWGTLIAIGAKHIETRTWHTAYCGPLLIHQTKGLADLGDEQGLMALCRLEPFRSALVGAGYLGTPGLPRGAFVATCTLVTCVPTTAAEDGFFGGPRSIETGVVRLWKLTDQERAFGDYTDGRWAWLLANVRALPTPIPARGAPGLWTWEGALS